MSRSLQIECEDISILKVKYYLQINYSSKRNLNVVSTFKLEPKNTPHKNMYRLVSLLKLFPVITGIASTCLFLFIQVFLIVECVLVWFEV